MHLRKRNTCRVCGSSSLRKVIDLGPQYLQGSFIKPGKEMPSSRKIDCTLVRCNPEEDENACGLLQMLHSVPADILYDAYWYRSGTNDTMRNHLAQIVESVTSIINKKLLIDFYGFFHLPSCFRAAIFHNRCQHNNLRHPFCRNGKFELLP